MRDRREPTCSTCGAPHSTLLGQATDRAWCADCPWTAEGSTARIWALHHAREAGHAAGVA